MKMNNEEEKDSNLAAGNNSESSSVNPSQESIKTTSIEPSPSGSQATVQSNYQKGANDPYTVDQVKSKSALQRLIKFVEIFILGLLGIIIVSIIGLFILTHLFHVKIGNNNKTKTPTKYSYDQAFSRWVSGSVLSGVYYWNTSSSNYYYGTSSSDTGAFLLKFDSTKKTFTKYSISSKNDGGVLAASSTGVYLHGDNGNLIDVFNPDTGKKMATIKSPDSGSIGKVTVNTKYLWFTSDDKNYSWGHCHNSLYQYDVSTNAMVKAFHDTSKFCDQWFSNVESMSANDTDLWLVISGKSGSSYKWNGTLFDFGNSIAVYSLDKQQTTTLIDLHSNTLISQVNLKSPNIINPSRIVATNKFVYWINSPNDENNNKVLVEKINADSRLPSYSLSFDTGTSQADFIGTFLATDNIYGFYVNTKDDNGVLKIYDTKNNSVVLDQKIN